MACLVLLRNPLTPQTREVFPLAAGTPVIDWLTAEHPDGFGMPIRFHVNGEEKPLDDLDYEVKEDDVVAIALMPADPVTLTTIGIGFLLSAALAVASYFAMQAFMPKEAPGMEGESSTYAVSSQQNAAKPGEPIPVVYGTVLTSPDYVAQPYTWYSWSLANNEEPLNGIQYLDMIMCVGQGTINVTDVFVGDTDATTLDPGVVTWRAFTPTQHQKKMGVIDAGMGTDFYENVITSAEVSNQELADLNATTSYFATCKPGQKGKTFQVDLIAPNGMFFVNAGDGQVQGFYVSFTVNWVELDDNDVQIGPVYSQNVDFSSFAPNVNDNTCLTTPMRRTFAITTVKSARWAVKITRTRVSTRPQKGASLVIWSALKLVADYPVTPVYGDVTLLAVRIKASRGLGNDAAVRVRVKATRQLAPPSGGTLANTTNAADAFADVYLDANYGAARPRSELDVTTLNSLRTKWAAYQFNYVFSERTTVWEALRTITNPFAAEPLPLGAAMSVAQDGVKAVRSMLFTDANIISDSMNIAYSFDEEGAPDGIEIEYTNPTDFNPSYVVYPTTSLRPERFSLPGVTSATHASQYARLTWQRRQGQRKTVTFDTELEGLILQLGDRIGISHNVPKWGDGGLILSASGNTLTVDHNLNWSAGTKYVLLRNVDGSVSNPIVATRGTKDNIIVLATTPTSAINFDNDFEYTSFAFGDATTLVRDFIVMTTRPNGGNTVTVEAVNYNASIYTGAMTFMGG